jgi:hypothetical protein
MCDRKSWRQCARVVQVAGPNREVTPGTVLLSLAKMGGSEGVRVRRTTCSTSKVIQASSRALVSKIVHPFFSTTYVVLCHVVIRIAVSNRERAVWVPCTRLFCPIPDIAKLEAFDDTPCQWRR